MRTVDAAGLKIGDSHPPRIMGVLNVSEESPYDPSVFHEPAEAAEYVDVELIDEGADIVDIGLESANKRFDVLSAEEELQRLDVAAETIASVSGDAVFSIETRYHEVAEAALKRGFEMVNDICGFADPKMPDICTEYDVAVGKMASPPDLTSPGAIADVDHIYDALTRNGFTEKTIIDPAFGGWSEEKTVAEDRETFDRLREFRSYGRPMLVSINRKNFLRSIANRSTEDALAVSLAATSMAVERGAHVIRTHDVAETRDAALIGDRFTPARTYAESPVTIAELDIDTVKSAERHFEQMEMIPSTQRIQTEALTRVFELRDLDDQHVSLLSNAVLGTTARFIPDSTGEHGLLIATQAGLDAIEANLSADESATSSSLHDIFRTQIC
ncbi:MAG: dihydropteroate synthase related enzyme [Haloquadratum sp. J07HQX50]|nr:MAG: dihydropteroate synthase related enzyme [Haloquadratum sp. J07HQX50]